MIGRESMARWDLRFSLVVAASLAVLGGLVAGLALDAGRSYPGFFAAPDFRLFPADRDARAAGLRAGDRLVAVDGASPLTLAGRVRDATGPVRYDVEPAGRRLTVELAPRRLGWSGVVDHFGIYVLVSALMLGAGALVYAQNPAAAPNRRFPHLHVLLGRLERGGPGGGAGRPPDGRDGGRPDRAAPVDPRLGVLPDVPGEPGARERWLVVCWSMSGRRPAAWYRA